MNTRPKTIFIDIDGTLISHSGSLSGQLGKTDLLPGSLEKLLEWDRNGYNIILITGRRESMRKKTKKQLSKLGIFYDKLIMGIGGGSRIIINDRKPNSTDDTCFAINIDRNQGIEKIDI